MMTQTSTPIGQDAPRVLAHAMTKSLVVNAGRGGQHGSMAIGTTVCCKGVHLLRQQPVVGDLLLRDGFVKRLHTWRGEDNPTRPETVVRMLRIKASVRHAMLLSTAPPHPGPAQRGMTRLDGLPCPRPTATNHVTGPAPCRLVGVRPVAGFVMG